MKERPEEYLLKKGFEFRHSGSELTMNCPFCGDTEHKFSMNAETGLWQCFHMNRCGKKGGLNALKRELGDKVDFEPARHIYQAAKKSYTKPTAKSFSSPTDALYEWFARRKIKRSTVDRFGVMRSDGGDIAFPYTVNGELLNVKYRSMTEKKFRQEKNAEKTLFGHDLITDKSQLVIVEGECDAMAAWAYGIEAVSLPSGIANSDWIESEWAWLEQFDRILIAVDMDEAGRKGLREIAERLGTWRCFEVVLPAKDLNDCLIQGVPTVDVLLAFDGARDFRPEELATIDRYEDATLELLNDPDSLNGDKIGTIDGLEKFLHGWRPGEVTVWTGKNSSGENDAAESTDA
jgi:twinkle protein